MVKPKYKIGDRLFTKVFNSFTITDIKEELVRIDDQGKEVREWFYILHRHPGGYPKLPVSYIDSAQHLFLPNKGTMKVLYGNK